MVVLNKTILHSLLCVNNNDGQKYSVRRLNMNLFVGKHFTANAWKGIIIFHVGRI